MGRGNRKRIKYAPFSNNSKFSHEILFEIPNDRYMNSIQFYLQDHSVESGGGSSLTSPEICWSRRKVAKNLCFGEHSHERFQRQVVDKIPLVVSPENSFPRGTLAKTRKRILWDRKTDFIREYLIILSRPKLVTSIRV